MNGNHSNGCTFRYKTVWHCQEETFLTQTYNKPDVFLFMQDYQQWLQGDFVSAAVLQPVDLGSSAYFSKHLHSLSALEPDSELLPALGMLVFSWPWQQK